MSKLVSHGIRDAKIDQLARNHCHQYLKDQANAKCTAQ